ncbi:MAG: SurA N-terminal domain-containing protein [Deltaproteobacteria bacterium]|nr:SurA N-terminal domain-containing protein [Deltaproteobacteria bacterium]
MLRFLRTKATSFFIKALFGMIIVVFVFWGIGTFTHREKVVAEVGKYRVYQSEYYDEYKRLLEYYRTLLKERLDEETLNELRLKEKAMENLIDRYLLLLIAEKMGVTVSDREYMEHLEKIEAFKIDGRFNKERFLEVLKRNNIDPKIFETRERKSLEIMKVSEILKDILVYLSENEIWEEFKRENGFIRLRYAVFSPDDFKDKVEISESELNARYEKEKSLYMSEPTYRLLYIVLDHTGPIRDDKAYMELIKIRDLESFAKNYNLSVFDTGIISEGQLKNRFNEIKDFAWIKDLRKGDISLPMRTGSKSYIFQLTEFKKAEPLEKGVVLKKLKEKMILEKAKELAKQKAFEAQEKGTIKFEKLTDFVRRNSNQIPNIGPIPEEHRDLFKLDDENPVYRKPVEISGKFYVFSFESEKLPEKEVWEKKKRDYQTYVYLKKREDALNTLLRYVREKEKIRIFWQEI